MTSRRAADSAVTRHVRTKQCWHQLTATARQDDPVQPKYEPLTRYLQAQAGGEVVTLYMVEIARLVDGLPPSSAERTWWANTDQHSQALGWLQAGRRVIEVRPGNVVGLLAVGGAQRGGHNLREDKPAGAARRRWPTA